MNTPLEARSARSIVPCVYIAQKYRRILPLTGAIDALVRSRKSSEGLSLYFLHNEVEKKAL